MSQSHSTDHHSHHQPHTVILPNTTDEPTNKHKQQQQQHEDQLIDNHWYDTISTFWRQLTALLYKNYLLKKRMWFSTLLEIGLPVAVMGLMIWIRFSIPREHHGGVPNPASQSFNGEKYAIEIAFAIQTLNYVHPLLVFIPSPSVDPIAQAFVKKYPILYPNVVTMDSVDTLNKWIFNDSYGVDASHGQILGAVVMNDIGTVSNPIWSYEIRQNTTSLTISTAGEQFDMLSDAYNNDWNTYLMSRGQMFLQNFMDNYIIQQSATNPGIQLNRQWNVTPFPWLAYINDNFMTIMTQFIGIFFTLVYIWPLTRLVKSIVDEREKGIYDNLAMMGMNNMMNFISWFITYTIIQLCTAGLITLATYNNVFRYSSPGYILLYFYLFGFCVFSFGYMMSTIFTSSRSAATMSALIFLTLYFAFYAVYDTNVISSQLVQTLACLHAPICFGITATTIGQFETAGVGLHSSNVDMLVENFSFDIYIYMMVADFFLYLFIAYCVTQWQESRRLRRVKQIMTYYTMLLCTPIINILYPSHNKSIDTDHKPIDQQPSDGNIESVNDSIQSNLSISIQNLTKQFMGENNQKRTVVNNFTLDIYSNQILSLLGHNGAGKSTLISLLTGVNTPTSGTAFINGYDIQLHMKHLRKQLGVCTQHNALFDTLTVDEHLRLYAYIKGVSYSQRDNEVDSIALSIGLDHMMNVQSMNLSGGYKRKLCVALALIGNSKIVFLDEPTAGMDPYARRFTWDILRKYKHNRTIILTTHLMDEADYLGDRIAIMSSGQLQCCGSSLYLKNKYGVGYSLTLVKNQSFNESHTMRLIHKHVVDAECVSNSGNEYSVRLPTESTQSFADLFDELDQSLESCGVSTYGMSMTTLEEVFLRVGNDDNSSHNKNMAIQRQLPRAPSFSSAMMQHTDNELSLVSNTNNAQHNELTNDQYLIQRQQSLQNNPTFDTTQTQQSIYNHTPSGTPHGKLSTRHSYYSTPQQHSRQSSTLELPSSVATGGTVVQLSDHEHVIDVQHSSTDSTHSHSSSPVMPSTPPFPVAQNHMFDDEHDIDDTVRKHSIDSGSSNNSGIFPWLTDSITTIMSTDSQIQWRYRFRKFGRQYTALIIKRFHAAKRDKKTWLWTLIYPIALTAFGLGMVTLTQNQPLPALTMTPTALPSQPEYVPVALAVNSIDIFNNAVYPTDVVQFLSVPQIDPANNVAMSLYLNSTYYSGYGNRYAAYQSDVTYDGYTLNDNSAIHINTTYTFALPLAYNMYSNQLLQLVNNNPQAKITTIINPLPQLSNLVPIQSALVAVVLAIGFAFLPAHFISYIVYEKQTNVKHQQLIAGVSTIAYWLANLTFDIINYMVPAMILFSLIVGFNINELIGINSGATVLSIILFGFSVIPFSYCCSFMFRNDTSAQNLMLVLFIVTGAVLLIASLALDQTTDSMIRINNKLKYFYRIFPSYAFGESIANLMLRSSIYFNPVPLHQYDMDVTGWPFIYMAGESILFLVLLYIFDCIAALQNVTSAIWATLCCRRHKHNESVQPMNKQNNNQNQPDADIIDEKNRLLAQAESRSKPDLVQIMGLSKIYNTELFHDSKIAVNDLYLGIQRNQCFGFLGTNGAGKTTTMKMLTGDETPSSGTVKLHGHDLVTELRKIRRMVGYALNSRLFYYIFCCDTSY